MSRSARRGRALSHCVTRFGVLRCRSADPLALRQQATDIPQWQCVICGFVLGYEHRREEATTAQIYFGEAWHQFSRRPASCSPIPRTTYIYPSPAKRRSAPPDLYCAIESTGKTLLQQADPTPLGRRRMGARILRSTPWEVNRCGAMLCTHPNLTPRPIVNPSVTMKNNATPVTAPICRLSLEHCCTDQTHTWTLTNLQ